MLYDCGGDEGSVAGALGERSTRERTFGSSPVTALRHHRAPELARAAPPPPAVTNARHAAATARGPAVHAILLAGKQISCCTGATREVPPLLLLLGCRYCRWCSAVHMSPPWLTREHVSTSCSIDIIIVIVVIISIIFKCIIILWYYGTYVIYEYIVWYLTGRVTFTGGAWPSAMHFLALQTRLMNFVLDLRRIVVGGVDKGATN